MDAPAEDPPFSYSSDADPYIFRYWSGLSPIKPDDHIDYIPSLSSTSSWSPTSVFTSPHVSSHNELRSLQSHAPFLEAPEPNVSSSECGLQISSSDASVSYTSHAHYGSTHPIEPQENTDQGNALVGQLSKICKVDVPQASIHDRGSQGSDVVQGSFAPASEIEVPRCDWGTLNNPNEIGTLDGLINKSLDPPTRPGNFMPELAQNTFRNLHHTSKPGATTENEQMQNNPVNFAVMASNPNERMYNDVIGMPGKYPAGVSNATFRTLQYSEWNVPSDNNWLIPNKFLIPATSTNFSHTSSMPRTDSRMIMNKGWPSKRQISQTNSTPSLHLSERQHGHQISSMHYSQPSSLTFPEGFHKNRSNRKRCKSEPAVEGEGCKHCKCKSSTCLKLYCECFASRAFCTGPCSCKNCSNKPTHEHKVLEARRAIESRNPLAFAPKIIRSADSLLGNGVNPNDTPASTRHRRGCSCKKSGCQKQYCECYQNGVGCSIRCRCEGCKNAYGRNYGSSELRIETEAQGNGSCETLSVEKVPHVTEALNNELGHPNSAATSPTASWCSFSAPLRVSSRRKRRGNFTSPAASRFRARQRLHERNVRQDQSEFENNFQSNTQMGMPKIHQVDDGSSITGIDHCSFSVREIFHHPSPPFPPPNPHQ